MCDTRGYFHGSTLSGIRHSAARLGHGIASALLTVIDSVYSSGQFWLVKITPTNTPKSRCILPTLYNKVADEIRNNGGKAVALVHPEIFFGYQNCSNLYFHMLSILDFRSSCVVVILYRSDGGFYRSLYSYLSGKNSKSIQ